MNKSKMIVNYQPIEWKGDMVKLLDQTLLPAEEVYLEITDYHEIMTAIKELKIRGAPAIGRTEGFPGAPPGAPRRSP